MSSTRSGLLVLLVFIILGLVGGMAAPGLMVVLKNMLYIALASIALAIVVKWPSIVAWHRTPRKRPMAKPSRRPRDLSHLPRKAS
jgi:hypothetical protein